MSVSSVPSWHRLPFKSVQQIMLNCHRHLTPPQKEKKISASSPLFLRNSCAIPSTSATLPCYDGYLLRMDANKTESITRNKYMEIHKIRWKSRIRSV